MIKHLFFAISILLVCACSKKDNPPQEEENRAPSAPQLSYPTDNLLCIDNTLLFKWNASSDADGDTVTYEVQVANDNQFTNLVHNSSGSSATEKEITLDKGTAFYWRVRASDNKGNSSDFSEVNQFYTEGEGIVNHLPFTPSLVNPVLESSVSESSVTLEWSASDVDNDPLTFNVYVGTDQNPGLVSEKQSGISYTVNSLQSGTTYYWKIEVLDGKNAKTIGQVWSFNKEN